MEQSAQKQKPTGFSNAPQDMNYLFFCCFYLWGRKATAQLGSMGNKKQIISSRTEQSLFAQRQQMQILDRKCVAFVQKRKYVTRLTGRNLRSDFS